MFKRSLLGLAALLASTNSYANSPRAQAGQAAYYYWKPILNWFAAGGFAGVIIGPKQRGYEFKHYKVQLIDINRRTYTETFQIIDNSQIMIHFEVHFGVRPDPTPEAIRELVEHYGGAQWYADVAREPLKTFVRDAIGGQDTQTLSTQQDVVQQKIFDSAQKWIQDRHLPIILDQVSVGNFVFPDQISQAAAEKQANLQRLQSKSTLLDIARKDAEIAAANAEGIRRAQDIINQTLSPLYVSHEMIKALEAIANKAGNTIVFIPTGPNGVPMFNNMTTQQQLPGMPQVLIPPTPAGEPAGQPAQP